MKKERLSTNYIYFVTFFSILFFLPLWNIFFLKAFSFAKDFPLIFHLFCQSTLLTCLAALLYQFFEKAHRQKLALTTMCLYSFFLFCQILDFFLLRIIGLSLYSLLFSVVIDQFENFIELLKASTLPWYFFFYFFLLFAFIPILGYLFYNFTKKISNYALIYLSPKKLVTLCLTFAFFEFFFSLTLPYRLNPMHRALLPCKTIAFCERNSHINRTLKHKKTPMLENLSPLEHSPNIFLFVVESLRNDFITRDVAPTLYSLQQEQKNFFSFSFANSNATPLSWYSILNGKLPFHWKENPKKGGFSIQLMKKMGYDIHVLTASGLQYFNMKNILFGKEGPTTFYCPDPSLYPEASHRDNMILEKLSKDIADKKEKNFFIIFLESTHFPYYFKNPIFQPICEKHGVFKNFLFPSSLHKTVNRYKNAIHFIDEELALFLHDLKEKNLYEDSILMITADHGEEFLEQGQLFHASRLSFEQTRVPILLKFPPKKIASPTKKRYFPISI